MVLLPIHIKHLNRWDPKLYYVNDLILRQNPEVCPDSQRVSGHDDDDDDDDDDADDAADAADDDDDDEDDEDDDDDDDDDAGDDDDDDMMITHMLHIKNMYQTLIEDLQWM